MKNIISRVIILAMTIVTIGMVSAVPAKAETREIYKNNSYVFDRTEMHDYTVIVYDHFGYRSEFTGSTILHTEQETMYALDQIFSNFKTIYDEIAQQIKDDLNCKDDMLYMMLYIEGIHSSTISGTRMEFYDEMQKAVEWYDEAKMRLVNSNESM